MAEQRLLRVIRVWEGTYKRIVRIARREDRTIVAVVDRAVAAYEGRTQEP